MTTRNLIANLTSTVLAARILLLLTVSLVLSLLPAHAEWATANQTARFWQERPKAPLKTEKLTAKIALPDIPEYTGRALFESGSTVLQPAGTSYIERFRCAEDRPHIIEWYVGALRTYGWKIQHADQSTIFCEKDGSNCTIVAMGLRDKNCNAILTICSFEKSR